jgi:hypothetical protein
VKNLTIGKIVWCSFVLLVLYLHLLIGTLLAIATAFYWLLEERLIPRSEKHSELWCVVGEHRIGNEPYTFRPNGDAICLRCQKQQEEELDQLIARSDEKEKKKDEWNNMTEEQREERRQKYLPDYCPKCEKPLERFDKDGKPNTYSSCPLCFEFANRPNAPMHRVKRIKEWVSLSDSEKEKREADFIAQRERNLSKWAVKGDDGVWRRKDNGQVVES